MKKINLSKKQIALIDDEDYEKVNKFKWHVIWYKKIKSFYVRHVQYNNKKQEIIYMHRLIMGLTKGDRKQVDHINHDTLDNRKKI